LRNLQAVDASVIGTFPAVDERQIDELLSKELAGLNRKIVVLDDDPTGVQTVHDISVYTDWEEGTLEKGFAENNSMFFILTNSRSFIKEQTVEVHRKIVKNIVSASKITGRDYIIISRSDSTLRGHYPIETQILWDELERRTNKRFDGEIIFPFFKEGGRFTIDNIHYVKDKDKLIPAGMTEFAKDKTFGYQSSHLGEWCEEKTQGAFKSDEMIYISLKDLRACNFDKIENQLLSATDFNKVIVNAVDYADVKVFAITHIRALAKGKEYIFRSAAAITKVLGGVPDKPLLTKEELVEKDNANGGIVIVGSHVNKTTQQLEYLKNCRYKIEFIEFNQHLVLNEGGLETEVERVVSIIDKKIKNGDTVAVYTRRDRFDLDSDDKDKQLMVSVRISDAVTSIIEKLSVRPNFIIAKGGITSSDIGTRALRVHRATVMGQIKPGIPVWMTDQESKFPNMPYIIFPGNVGEISTLCEVVEILMA
jgi:uncharacterized protein YgbK (DUF1537 family)